MSEGEESGCLAVGGCHLRVSMVKVGEDFVLLVVLSEFKRGFSILVGDCGEEGLLGANFTNVFDGTLAAGPMEGQISVVITNQK